MVEGRREILVVDDERALVLSLTALLEGAGYRVRTASDGATALAAYFAHRPDLVLLDVMMPCVGGHDVCRTIRAHDATTPILFLTAYGDEKNEIDGLALGADDYLEKTLSDGLLLSRIAAALRRAEAKPKSTTTSDFAFGVWRVMPNDFSMCRDDGARVPLADREIALLRLFSAHPTEALSRDFLLAQAWGGKAAVSDGALSVAMSLLREKLGEEGARIETVHGVGYSYRPSRKGDTT